MNATKLVCLSFALTCATAACGDDATESASEPVKAKATLAALPYADNPSPDIEAQIAIEQDGTETTVTITVTNCPEGEHMIHIHEGTSCGDDGIEAGAHWMATTPLQKHGGEEHADPGALGMVSCGADETGMLTYATDEWTLGSGDATDPTGRTIVLHGLDATYRVACGVITAE